MPWQLASAFEILQKPDDFFNIKNTLCLSDIIHSSIIVRLDIICSQHQRLCTLKGRVNATIQARNFQTLAVSDIIISSSCQIVSAAIVPSYYEGFPKLCHQQKLYYDYLKTNTKASPKKKKTFQANQSRTTSKDFCHNLAARASLDASFDTGVATNPFSGMVPLDLAGAQ